MWHRVARLVIQEISKERSVFVLRVKQPSLLELLDPKYEDATFLLNVRNHQPSDMGVTFQKT
jgi:hypothetical protein